VIVSASSDIATQRLSEVRISAGELSEASPPGMKHFGDSKDFYERCRSRNKQPLVVEAAGGAPTSSSSPA
jgi:hypothetical protein